MRRFGGGSAVSMPLYISSCSVLTSNAVSPSPLQRGAIRANRASVEPVRIQHYLFTRILKLNAQEDNCDEILANRGKLRYRSAWA